MKIELSAFFHHPLLPPQLFYGFMEKQCKLYFCQFVLCSFLQVIMSMRNLLMEPELFCALARQTMSLRFTHGFCCPRYLHASFRFLCVDPGKKVIIACVHWQIWLATHAFFKTCEHGQYNGRRPTSWHGRPQGLQDFPRCVGIYQKTDVGRGLLLKHTLTLSLTSLLRGFKQDTGKKIKVAFSTGNGPHKYASASNYRAGFILFNALPRFWIHIKSSICSPN